MKRVLLMISTIVAVVNSINGQCSQPGLKIYYDACDTPSNLSIKKISCSEVELEWKGQKQQNFLIKTSQFDMRKKFVSRREYQVSSNQEDTGIYKAAIQLAGPGLFTWAVETACFQNGVSYYSRELNGDTVEIPVCTEAERPVSISVVSLAKIYPNPASAYIIIDGVPELNIATTTRITNAAGILIFKQGGNQIKKMGEQQWKINLPPMIQNGVYFLEIINNKSHLTFKFEVLKN